MEPQLRDYPPSSATSHPIASICFFLSQTDHLWPRATPGGLKQFVAAPRLLISCLALQQNPYIRFVGGEVTSKNGCTSDFRGLFCRQELCQPTGRSLILGHHRSSAQTFTGFQVTMLYDRLYSGANLLQLDEKRRHKTRGNPVSYMPGQPKPLRIFANNLSCLLCDEWQAPLHLRLQAPAQ
jgi:hypothetical protein